MSSSDNTSVQGQLPIAPSGVPERPRMTNGATVHGLLGIRSLRHRCELPLLWVSLAITVVAYATWIVLVAWLVLVPEPTGLGAQIRSFFLDDVGGSGSQLLLLIPALPLLVWVLRAIMYAQMRASSVQMSPTQFPEGYRMVVEAAHQLGLRRVPDAYVTLGNGVVNAFSSGHGFRRFVVVHSDLFEVGGSARDPEALRFVIAHEVGHLAAGHTSYWRILVTNLATNIPLLGTAFSRAQEYTADNHGYAIAPSGAAGAIGLVSAGKYLGTQVNFHAMADRATREKGLWLHIVNWMSSHPVNTWRAHALRDRSRRGRIMFRPRESTAWYPPVQPSGYERSATWPTPAQALQHLDTTRPQAPTEEQFGRYPGVTYQMPVNDVHWADPVPVSAPPSSGPQTSPHSPAPNDPYPPEGTSLPPS